MLRDFSSHRRIAALAGIAIALSVSARAQASHWATAGDATAKMMIDAERKWAESGCTHNGIEKTILAEDFHATAPDGTQYDKKEAVADDPHPKSSESECVMYDVKVHFFGDNIAVLYGSESALVTEEGGKQHRRKLTWVDTWLKRDGKWQIVAAEDMPSEIK
jgi:Domain of unknown function (DUF4440)